jgi:hypothetical protein
MRITWKFPIRFCVLSFHLCFCSLVAVVVVAPYDQMERNSTSLLLLLLVGTVTRLIRSRSLRSRGPHSFFFVFFFFLLFFPWNKKERNCVKERNAHISQPSSVMCLYSLSAVVVFYIISTLDGSTRYMVRVFSLILFIYYSSMPHRPFSLSLILSLLPR